MKKVYLKTIESDFGDWGHRAETLTPEQIIEIIEYGYIVLDDDVYTLRLSKNTPQQLADWLEEEGYHVEF